MRRGWTSRTTLACTLAVATCSGDRVPDLPPEPWADRPVAEWPDFALTNEVRFADTTYHDMANGFLVDTGLDTVGVTVKHMFLVFREHQGLESIDLGDDFVSWRFRSSRDSARVVAAGRLITADPGEPVGAFNTLKDRDWLVFEVDAVPAGVYPLKVRYTPVRSGEVVYAVGRNRERRNARDPSRTALQRHQAMGSYYYVTPLTRNDPVETSGSAVIDEHGYLVGIVSGAVGELGVIGGVGYLRQLFDRHGIPYRPLDRAP